MERLDWYRRQLEGEPTEEKVAEVLRHGNWIGLAAFIGTTAIAALWLLFILQPVVQSLYRLGVREGVVAIALSLLPIHTGLHGIVENYQQLGGTRLAATNRVIGFALGHWPAVILALGLMILLAAQRVSRDRTQTPRLT